MSWLLQTSSADRRSTPVKRSVWRIVCWPLGAFLLCLAIWGILKAYVVTRINELVYYSGTPEFVIYDVDPYTTRLLVPELIRIHRDTTARIKAINPPGQKFINVDIGALNEQTRTWSALKAFSEYDRQALEYVQSEPQGDSSLLGD